MLAAGSHKKWRKWLLCGVGGALISLIYLSGTLRFVDDHLADIRFRIVRSDPSGDVVIVAIDPRSLRENPAWPWPRRLYGQAIDAIGGAGAARIAVDIDFSAPSDSAEDRALSDAIARAGHKVVLPVFEQPASARAGSMVATNPLPLFAGTAQLASVNVTPDRTGIVRKMARFVTWSGIVLPTFPIAASAVTGESTGQYYIDFGIRADRIATISIADVLAGTVDPSVFFGKIVFIGATALELGDKAATPVLGATSGVALQALATESVLLGRDLRQVSPWITLLVALATFVIMAWAIDGRRALVSSIVSGGFLIAVIGVPVAVQAALPLTIDATPGLLAVLGAFLVNTLYRLRDLDLRLISQALTLSRAESLMRRVVEATHDGIVVVDRNGIIRSSNPAAERIFRDSADKLQGYRITDLIGLTDPATASAPGSEGSWNTTEVTLQHWSGETSIIEVTFRSIPGETEGTHVAVIHDVTEDREREKQIGAARDQAEEANRSKTHFLANMSHELRTPLNAVIGFSEVMEAELYGPLGSDQYRDYSVHIRKSASHLLDLINDILDISAIEAGDRRMSEGLLDPAQVCQSALALLRGRAQASSIQLELAVAADCGLLFADRRMLMQILVNLVSNAIKFSSPSGSVKVQVSQHPHDGMTFSVIDQGIGIATENVPRVLKPFEQVEGAYSRRRDGVGLGLPLVKSLAEMHGAGLTLESELGKGTVAMVTFPPSRCKPRPSAAEPVSQAPFDVRLESAPRSVTLQ